MFTWLFISLSVDHHFVSGITIFGMVIDIIGALLLAYDLLGGKEVGARERPLRTLIRVIIFGIIGALLSLPGFAIGFPIAVKLHLHILDTLGYFSSLGVLLGYMTGWGFGCAFGFAFSSRTIREYKRGSKLQSKRRHIRWFRKAGEFGVWLVVGLICWFAGGLTVTSNRRRIWHKVAFGLGFSMMIGFVIGLFMRKRIQQKTNSDSQKQKLYRIEPTTVDVIPEPHRVEPKQLKMRTKRFRIVVGFGIGSVMGVLFWLGTVITLRLNLVQGFSSGFVAGLAGGLTDGFVYGYLVRRFLVQGVDKDSLVQPNLDKFAIVAGLIATVTTAFFYAWVFWLFFGGDLKIILFAGSFIGFIGGLGGGIFLCFAPLLEWRLYRLPDKRLGAVGAIMIFIGFIIQSFQYWIALLDVHVK
jgi:hypothetical protein